MILYRSRYTRSGNGMTEHNNQHEENAPAQAVILGAAVFRRLRKQHAARAQARRYFVTARKTALQRRLLMRMLKPERKTTRLHIVR